MSHQIPDDNKDEQKFLTLADKQPSLLLSGTVSPRSISTRQLSDNLQTTREGLINLMRKQGEGNDRIISTRGSGSGSDDENESFQSFGMPTRNKQGKGGNNQYEHGLTDSKELDNFGRNKIGGLSSQDSRNVGSASKGAHAQRGKYRSSDDNGTLGGGKNFDQENDEFFSSQNRKKDGPLYTRIFIDSFIPSLEGNRIFPLFNYGCAEKRERSNKDFYERKRKLSQKQLPVAGTEESFNVKVSQLPGDQRGDQKVKGTETLPKTEKLLKVQELDKVEQFQAEQGIRKMHKSKEFQQVGEIQVLQKVEKLQEVEQLQNVEEVQSLEQVEQLQNIKKEDQSLQKTEEQKVEEIQEFHNVEKTQEVLELHSVQQVEDKHEEIEFNKESPQVNQSTELAESTVKSNIVELSEQTKDSPVLATAAKSVIADRLIEVEQPSDEEQKLLHKLLRALLANDELIDIFCEKVIEKIAARNDFCGASCGSTCGGLNKPKTDKEK